MFQAHFRCPGNAAYPRLMRGGAPLTSHLLVAAYFRLNALIVLDIGGSMCGEHPGDVRVLFNCNSTGLECCWCSATIRSVNAGACCQEGIAHLKMTSTDCKVKICAAGCSNNGIDACPGVKEDVARLMLTRQRCNVQGRVPTCGLIDFNAGGQHAALAAAESCGVSAKFTKNGSVRLQPGHIIQKT